MFVFGCGNGDSKPAANKVIDKSDPVDPVRPVPGFGNLTVTSNGVATPMQRGFIKRVSLDQWRIQVSDKAGSCEELLSGVINSQQGATSFVATIAKHLAADGTETTVVTDLWSGGHSTKATLGTAEITGAADRDSKVEIELAHITDTDGARKLEIAGTFTAIGCGDAEPTGAGIPNVEHVSAARVTIAGKKLELKGAVKHGDQLTLSTGPKDCSDVQPWAQAVILHRNGRWELSGTLFGETSASPTTDLKVSPGTTGSTKDGPTIALTLAGAGKIGEYPVELEGTIEALDCAN